MYMLSCCTFHSISGYYHKVLDNFFHSVTWAIFLIVVSYLAVWIFHKSLLSVLLLCSFGSVLITGIAIKDLFVCVPDLFKRMYVGLAHLYALSFQSTCALSHTPPGEQQAAVCGSCSRGLSCSHQHPCDVQASETRDSSCSSWSKLSKVEIEWTVLYRWDFKIDIIFQKAIKSVLH